MIPKIARAVLPAFALAAGCAGAGENEYELVRSRTELVPVTLERTMVCVTRLVGSRVTFSGDGGYRTTFDIEKRCAGGKPEKLRDPGAAGTIQAVGDSIRFFDASGMPTGMGVLTADSLVVRGRVHTLIYARHK